MASAIQVKRLPSFLEKNEELLKFIWPSLKRAGYSPEEESLLRAVRGNKTRRLVYYASLGLRLFGTERSLLPLKGLAFYPMDDVKTSSVVTIGMIAGGKETQYFASLLDSPEYKYKMYPMIVLWEVGTELAVPSVARLAEKVLNKEVRVHGKQEVRYIIEYLSKYSSPEVDSLIGRLVKFEGDIANDV